MRSESKSIAAGSKPFFPVIVGIAGGSASGKTTIVNGILSRFNSFEINIILHDSYYYDRSHLSIEERADLNYDHPDALETSLLIEHLKRLRAGEEIECPRYDFATHVRRPECRRVISSKVVIVEGLLVLANPELRELLDIKVYIDADHDLRFIRRMERDICDRGRTRESVVKQYLEFVRPMHLEYVEPSKHFADVVIFNEGDHAPAIELLVDIIGKAIREAESSE